MAYPSVSRERSRADAKLCSCRAALVACPCRNLDNQVASTGYVVLRTNKSNYHKFLFFVYEYI